MIPFYAQAKTFKIDIQSLMVQRQLQMRTAQEKNL